MASKVDPVAKETSGLLDRLYREHMRDLCRFIQHRFGSGPPEPEEVAQIAFARYAVSAQTEAIENPKAFLYRTALNVVIDQHRRAVVRQRHVVEVLSEPSERDDFDAERVLASKERLAVIEAVISAMPERQRRVFVLARVDGLSYAEVARRTMMSETNVKRLVVRAIVECQAALRQADGEGEEAR